MYTVPSARYLVIMKNIILYNHQSNYSFYLTFWLASKYCYPSSDFWLADSENLLRYSLLSIYGNTGPSMVLPQLHTAGNGSMLLDPIGDCRTKRGRRKDPAVSGLNCSTLESWDQSLLFVSKQTFYKPSKQKTPLRAKDLYSASLFSSNMAKF